MLSRRIARPTLGLAFIAAFVLTGATRARAGETRLEPVTVPLPGALTPAPTTSESPARRDPTGALSVIPVPDTLAEAKDVSEVLAQAPGVVIQDVGGLGQSKAVQLRGASSNAALVYLDGIPLNGAGAISDLSLLPAADFERIEVLRGGGGGLYGSGGLGGVVNLVSRAPRPGTHAWAEATYGSFASTLAQLGASTDWTGGSAILLLDGLDTGGDFPYLYDPLQALPGNALDLRHRANNDAHEGSGFLKVRERLGTWTTELLVQAGAMSRGLAGTVDLPQFAARQQTDQALLGLRAEHGFANGLELTLRGYGRREHDAFTKIAYSRDTWQVQTVAGLAADATWLVGGFNGLSASLEVGSDALRNPSPVQPHRFTLGALLEDELLFFAGALSLAPAFRVDQVGALTGVSPKLGVRGTLPRGFEVRGNVGQAFRAPSFLELYVEQGQLLPNPTLKPERALSADLGVTHLTRTTALTVAGFASEYENLIQYEYEPPFRARPYNFSTAGVAGLEVEGKWTATAWLSVRASYTFQRSADLHDEPRYYLKTLPNHPEHRVFARADPGVTLLHGHAEVLYQSAQTLNRSASLSLPERVFVNAGLASEFLRHPAVSVGVEAKNLFDVRAADYDGYPLPGRAFYATARVTLDFPSHH